MSHHLRNEQPLDDLQFRAAEDEAGTEIPGEFEGGLFCGDEYLVSVRLSAARLRELRGEIDELIGENSEQEEIR